MARTNIVINDRLVKDGLKLTNLKTKKELVNYAFEELVKRMRRKGLLKLEGMVKWEGIDIAP